MAADAQSGYAAPVDLAELVRRFGHDAEQAAVLGGRWRVFRAAGIAGAVPYRLRFGTALCPGSPLCAAEDTMALLAAFLAACAARRWHAVFVPAPAEFARIAARRSCAAWKIGEQPLIDLARWPPPGRAAENLRTARNRAARAGVVTREWQPGEQPQRLAELRELRTAWLSSHGGAPLGFVLGGDPFAPAAGRRWFLAERAGRIEAVAVTAALPARRAVALQHFLRRPSAPPGCIESAIAAALLAHHEDGADTALLSLAPLRGLHRSSCGAPLLIGRGDRGHRGALRSLRWLRAHGSGLYRAASLERFKQNLAPARWEPAYLVHYPARLLPRMAVAAALELAPGGPRWLTGRAVTVAARRLSAAIGQE